MLAVQHLKLSTYQFIGQTFAGIFIFVFFCFSILPCKSFSAGNAFLLIMFQRSQRQQFNHLEKWNFPSLVYAETAVSSRQVVVFVKNRSPLWSIYVPAMKLYWSLCLLCNWTCLLSGLSYRGIRPKHTYLSFITWKIL